MSIFTRLLRKLHNYHSFYNYTAGGYGFEVTVKLCSTEHCRKFEVDVNKYSKESDEKIVNDITQFKEKLIEKKRRYHADKQRRAWLEKKGLQ